MAMQHSADFKDFSRSQRQINQFLWSSEFAYELIRQKTLTAAVRADPRSVHEIFADVDCHAFVQSTKARKAIDSGQTPRHVSKYEAGVATFEEHLRLNMEPVCRYVVIRFHSALERFLFLRAKPFLGLEKIKNGKKRRAAEKRFQETSYLELEALLAQKTTLRASIDPNVAFAAQGFRMLRNEFIHKEEDWTPPWSDSKLRATIEKTFPKKAQALIQLICEPVARQTAKDPTTPAIFFYALFCLTDYRNLAAQVDLALPMEHGSSRTLT